MKRIQGVDVFKLIAVSAVVVIHTIPFEGVRVEEQTAYACGHVFLNQLSRFAVPFFFVVSGFFWGRKIRAGTPVGSASVPVLRRLLFLFAAWSVIYLLPYNVSCLYAPGSPGPVEISRRIVADAVSNPLRFLLVGTAMHLWFLVALACAVAVSALFLRSGAVRSLFALSVALYVFGLLARAYSVTPLGIGLDFDTRTGPFFSTIFFVTGYALSGRTPTPCWFVPGLLVFAAGCLAHFSEIGLLWKVYDVYPTRNDYVVGTYFMGLGAAVAALSDHPLIRSVRMSSLGKYSLGIYAVHVVFVKLLEPLDKMLSHPVWEVGHVILVLLLSAGTVSLLLKSRFTKPLVA